MRTLLQPTANFLLTLALAATALGVSARPVLAQGRGGGMSGGGMGRGGMGGAGGMRSGSSRGERSGASAVKATLKDDDQIAFILDHKKPIRITDQQADTLKAYRKEMLEMQEPLFKSIDRIYTEGTRSAGQRGGGRAPGEMGGGTMPDTVRSLVARLTDIQDAYRDRAHARLSAEQVHVADSLQNVWRAEQRDKQAKAMRR